MANLAGVPQSRFFPAKLEAEGDDAIFNTLLDPKKALDDAFLKTKPTSRRRRQGASPMLNALGESVSLERLRRLPGFQALEHELRQGLEVLGILR